jgi:hypothetical protein
LSWMVKFSGAMTAWICCANVWAKDKKLKLASLKFWRL